MSSILSCVVGRSIARFQWGIYEQQAPVNGLGIAYTIRLNVVSMSKNKEVAG